MRAVLLVITALVMALSLSCGGAAEFPPTRIPRSVSAPKVVELPTDVRPTGMWGDWAAGIGRDGEVYLLNITDGERRQVTDDGHPKYEAVISDDYVAWTDRRRKIELPRSNGGTDTRYGNDIFLRNLNTGKERRITDVPAERKRLRVSGSRLVWQDNRNELEEGYTNYDIYAYDLETGRETPVAVAPGAQRFPAIYEDTVVWADNRNSPLKGTLRAGCGNCPDNTFDIYSYDFSTGEETLLSHSGGYNGAPSIHGRQVVWHGLGEDRTPYIKLLDLETGRERTLAGVESGAETPIISDGFVVWTAGEPCDVFFNPPSETRTGAFSYNLMTGEIRQISDYVEPHVLLHQDVALVVENCFGIIRLYSVFLE